MGPNSTLPLPIPLYLLHLKKAVMGCHGGEWLQAKAVNRMTLWDALQMRLGPACPSPGHCHGSAHLPSCWHASISEPSCSPLGYVIPAQLSFLFSPLGRMVTNITSFHKQEEPDTSILYLSKGRLLRHRTPQRPQAVTWGSHQISTLRAASWNLTWWPFALTSDLIPACFIYDPLFLAH